MILLLSPFAPHICEELWSRLGHTHSIFTQAWPEYEEIYTQLESIEFVVQINGNVRSKMKIGKNMGVNEIEKLVLANQTVQTWIKDKKIIKKIFIKNKLMNLVVG